MMLNAIFSVLLALAAFADASDDRSALKAYSNRHRDSGAGVALTPPIGKAPNAARQSQRFLQALVDELAGEKIKAKEIHVKVNIYSSLSRNAFATQPANPNDSTWSAHRYLGIAEDGKPVFEIGFLQGIFDTFRDKDELAFIVGHELGHVLSDHLARPSDWIGSTQKWYSSQANEVEADFFPLISCAENTTWRPE